MKIILLDKIQRLGEIGDVVDVNSGYARNFLIPQKKGSPLTLCAKRSSKSVYVLRTEWDFHAWMLEDLVKTKVVQK